MINILVFIGVIIWTFIYQIRIVPKYFNDDGISASVITSSSLHELPGQQRQIALDLAWAPLVHKLVNYARSINSFWLKANSVSMGAIGALLLFLTYILFSSANPDRKENPLFVAPIVIGSICFIVSVFQLKFMLSNLWQLPRLKIEEENRNRNIIILRSISVQYINDNFQKWLSRVDIECRSIAVGMAESAPENIFLMLSSASNLIAHDLPAPRIHLTYLFQNNDTLAAVSGIEFDVYATSYSLCGMDAGEPIFNSSEKWSSDEFHYADVTEVTYLPTATQEYVEGSLRLTLASGSHKLFAAAKGQIQGLVREIREKVRIAKFRTQGSSANSVTAGAFESTSISGSVAMYCGSCGKPRGIGNRFCQHCGGELT